MPGILVISFAIVHVVLRILPGLVVLAGVAVLIAAAFLLHPVAGLVALGLALVVVGAVLDTPPARRGRSRGA